jgi:hypothetical protein
MQHGNTTWHTGQAAALAAENNSLGWAAGMLKCTPSQADEKPISLAYMTAIPKHVMHAVLHVTRTIQAPLLRKE